MSGYLYSVFLFLAILVYRPLKPVELTPYSRQVRGLEPR